MAVGLWLAAVTLHDVVEGVSFFGDLRQNNDRNYNQRLLHVINECAVRNHGVGGEKLNLPARFFTNKHVTCF